MFGQYEIFDPGLFTTWFSPDIFIEPIAEIPFADIYSPFYDPGAIGIDLLPVVEGVSLPMEWAPSSLDAVVAPTGPSLLSSISSFLKILAPTAISILQAGGGTPTQAATQTGTKTYTSTAAAQGIPTTIAEMEAGFSQALSSEILGIPTWLILAGLGVGLIFGGRSKVKSRRRKSHGKRV